MAELICIVCPKGCHIKVSDTGEVLGGAGCEKGIAYAQNEQTNPMRVLTSTVILRGGRHPRLPVKTDAVIPKAKIFEAMQLLNGLTVQAPVARGQIVVANILGTGVNFVATAEALQV